MSERVIDKIMWEEISLGAENNNTILIPSTTYWQDVWRLLMKNKLAMIGLAITVFIVLFAFIGPNFTEHDFSTQQLEFANIPPSFDIYKVGDDDYIYMHSEYKLFDVTRKGALNDQIDEIHNDLMNRSKRYEINEKVVIIDYSYAALKPEQNTEGVKFKISVDGVNIKPYGRVKNQTYVLGTDGLGRDMLARVIHGAQISLTIAFVATLVNFIIGVLYGSVAGYYGGRVDNLMMRIVDSVNAIPLILYVILLSVIIGTGQKAIILAIGSVYWVNMARIVRGQVLSLKAQEFVLSARTIGASSARIIFKHLIPNAMGPIIVTLTMLIPNAIFIEAFLSFIGLGVSAPYASWGTLANDALGGLRSYPYQLIYPSLGISFTVLALNLIGDGLRDALNPKLR